MPVPANVRPTPRVNTESENKTMWDLIPEDTYQVEILDIDHRYGPSTFKDADPTEEFDWLKVTFVILQDEEFDGQYNGKQTTRGRRQWLDNVKWSMSPPGDYPASKLYRIASAANGGRTYNREECKNFDPNTLIGKQLKIAIKEKPSAKDPNRIFNNVTDFMTTRKILPSYDPENESFSRKPSDFDSDLDDADVPF